MAKVALLGMPNTGKSTFFNRLTGASARVGNWPGITVDLLSAKIPLGAHLLELIDLPGIFDFPGDSEDEKVVWEFLKTTPVDAIVVVLNSSQIDRQLHLLLQLKRLNCPMLVLLNMSDESQRYGIYIDNQKISDALDGAPVLSISAKHGDSYPEIRAEFAKVLDHAKAEKGDYDSTQAAENISINSDDAAVLQHQTEQLLENAVEYPIELPKNLTHKLDQVLMNPFLGLPLFFATMYLLFQTVFELGAPLQDAVAWVLDGIRGYVLEPALSFLPAMLQGLLLDGVYDGIATVASFVPIIVLFFLLMTIVEDSGYLSRAAFLMDALMLRLGLDGRSFVMLLMGFGCNVPALMGTRVMRTRGLRFLSMMIIPFSLCAARLQIFLFFIAALFLPEHAGLVLFSLYVASFFAAFLTAFLFKGRYPSKEPLVLELPPYRLPTVHQILLRAWLEVSHFLVRASRFIIIGVVLIWILTNFPAGVPAGSSETWAGQISAWLAPIFNPIGIEGNLIISLFFGFVAKEVVLGAMAVIYNSEGTGLSQMVASQLDWVQAYSFMLFTLLYTPCVSTIATIHAEAKHAGFTLLNLIWPLSFAWFISFVFYQSARALGY